MVFQLFDRKKAYVSLPILIFIFLLSSACNPTLVENSTQEKKQWNFTSTSYYTSSIIRSNIPKMTPTFTQQFTKTNTAVPYMTLSYTTTALPTVFIQGGGGGLIAYTVTKDYIDHIFIMRLDGSQVTQITNGEYHQYCPSWSPDGKQIVFAFSGEIKPAIFTTTIYIMQADGSGMKQLISSPVMEVDPAWSPDGQKIVFVSLRDSLVDPHHCEGDECNYELYIMDSNGSNIQRLTDDPGYDGEPSWSPDSKHITFTSSRNGKDQIYIMNSDGSDIRQITNNLAMNFYPSWSPNGRQIVYVSNLGGKHNIYVINIDGSNLKRLTFSKGENSEPSWSADGTRIVFISSRDNPNIDKCEYFCNDEIYVMDSDGTNVIRLTNTAEIESSPVWQP
jgi:Tol biopolymer transport system component